MITHQTFEKLTIGDKITVLFRDGYFITAIRYYSYKVNLYLLNNYYVEVFYNHKQDCIERIELMAFTHSRMKFYTDQIQLPNNLLG